MIGVFLSRIHTVFIAMPKIKVGRYDADDGNDASFNKTEVA